ncbi:MULTISPECIES: NrfD/PsrC family molybdoenzyme membrane anchor subunit [Anaerolinea]|uniref:NrfD/PsrC family molybdoenzyme membrane anchor subunit n=1 Tax=Anaerolinea TaxID=233189 RepID=UPI00260B7297|nr:NrfD/PsrC family molybdoenzyme membrane anchor subunit [Anaerolinea thermophila]
MAVEAKSLSTPIHGVDDEEAELREQLMFDPRPREELNRMVMESMVHTTPRYWAVVAFLAVVVLVCLFGAWGYMIATGIGLAGVRKPVYWGVFIVTFVFWIGISHAGTFVSAILRVFKAEFRRPFTRAAELMTTFGLAAGALYPLIHLGRVWVFYWMIPYPNARWLWPNFRSPLVWDFLAITTYLLSSTIYLYLPLIPDLAMARDRTKGWRHAVYKALALGWRGTEAEWARLRKAITIFAFAIIPVMFSVHTIVSWDFAVSQTPVWNSTIFGPYFIVGAILSGVSAVVTILVILRATLKHMDYFIRKEHLDALGKLLLVFSMAWAYFFFNDYLVSWYGGYEAVRKVLFFHSSGPDAWIWWSMIVFNVVIPWLTLWNRRIRRTPWVMLIITLLINVGMYFERYTIVPMTLAHQRFPFDWGTYVPRIEIIISIGTLALFILLYMLASRFIPMVPVWEVREGQEAHMIRQIGKARVPTVSELE